MKVMKGDRIALVAFAGAAFVQCPLTLDYGAAQMFLDYLDTELIPVQGTNIEDALNVSMGALESGMPGESGGKAVILITDGEEVSGDIAKAVSAAKEKGIKIYTVGIGSPEGAPIPDDVGGFKKDDAGNVIISRLAEGPLRDLAEGSGGAYVRASSAGIGLENIYRSSIKSGLEERDFDSSREKLWYERFQWLLGLAFILFLFEYFVRDVLPMATNLLLVGALGLGGATFFARNANAESEPVATATNPIEDYNAAVQSFRNGEFEKAKAGFTSAATSVNAKTAADAFYNLGNTEAALKNFEAAVAAYEKSLSHNQSDQQVRDNLAWARKKVKKQDQKKNEKNEKNEKNDQQDKKDENKEEKQDQQDNQDQKKDGQEQQDQKNQQDKQDKQDQEQKDQSEQKDQQPGENKDEGSKPKDAEKQESNGGEDQPSEQKKSPEPKPGESGEENKPDESKKSGEERDMAEGANGKPVQELKISKREAEVLLQSIDEMSRKDQLKREMRRQKTRQPQNDKDW